MESANIEAPRNKKPQAEGARGQDSSLVSNILRVWYRIAAPPEPAAGANFYERERVRRGRVASLAVTVFIGFLLVLLLKQAAGDYQLMQTVGLLVCLTGSAVGLFLNRRGYVELAGTLVLLLTYFGGTFAISNYPVGLSLDNLSGLYSSIIPEMIALAFFPASSLFIILCIDILQILAIVMLGPHDAAMAHVVHTDPLKILLPVYLLQVVTTITLYFWAHSTEEALRRADRAEELVAFERREKESQERELEQKRQLDVGIQQILQTHIAVANGDFKVRAPLQQDHVLWQVAVALNNMIGRLQNVSQRERELRQQLAKGDERTTDKYQALQLEAGKSQREKAY